MNDLIELVNLYIKVIQLDKIDIRVVETIVQNIMSIVPKNIDIEEKVANHLDTIGERK